jgi:hypothetical protein
MRGAVPLPSKSDPRLTEVGLPPTPEGRIRGREMQIRKFQALSEEYPADKIVYDLAIARVRGEIRAIKATQPTHEVTL